MNGDQPDSTYTAELLQRQDALQAEAHHVLAELDLLTLLLRAGQPEQIGSSVAGLMVWRDLDINVLCDQPGLDLIFETMKPLLTNPRITKLRYSNDTGSHTPLELRGDERSYFVVYYETLAGHEWKIDISLWHSARPRQQLPYLEYLAQTLTEETRLAILWIKDVWHHLPAYPYEVGGMDIYNAVLEHGVRTPDQFRAYLLERGLATN